MSTIERLSGMDQIWLQVEQASNPAHLTALIVTAGWTKPLAHTRLDALANAYGVRPDALMLSALGGAVGALLGESGSEGEGLEIRCLLPISLRNAANADRLGNHSGPGGDVLEPDRGQFGGEHQRCPWQWSQPTRDPGRYRHDPGTLRANNPR